MAKKAIAAKKRVVKIEGVGQLHVMSSFNNVIVTVANGDGQVISWSSAGKQGFRGSKKNTPYAAQMAAADCCKVAYDLGLRKVKAYVKGPGQGRESAIRACVAAGIDVTEIVDVTPMPFGEAIFGEDKVLAKRPYAPGQHGVNRRKKNSEYGTQLAEKQKAKYTYGVLEKQFRLLFAKAARTKGITGEILIQLLECRLDNIVYRLGMAPTRAAARQLVSHRHITVDGQVVNIPSYSVKPGQIVAVREKAKSLEVINESLQGFNHAKYGWLEWNEADKAGKLLNIPARAEIPENIKEQLIVELYSK